MKTKALLSALVLLTTLSCLGQWSYENFSEPKYRQGVATLGSKAYFAAGQNDSLNLSVIEIYDVSTETWDSAINLSVPRMHPACAAAGDKIFVAGGINFFTMEFFDEIDIWDTQTQQWSLEHLLFPRFSISAVSYENKVLFAGGANFSSGVFDVVEIYDIENGEWDFTTLSMGRSSMASAVVNDIAIFAGGYDLETVTDRVDLYNFTTNTWTTAALSEPRGFLAATTVGSKVYVAGGVRPDNTVSDRVDIYDAETNTWSTSALSEPRAMFQESAATVCDRKAIFAGGGEFDLTWNGWNSGSDVIDIYDSYTDTWSVDHMTKPLIMHACAGVENHFLVAGGLVYADPDSVYLTSNVEIFTDPDCSVGVGPDQETGGRQPEVVCHPNPTAGPTEFQISIFNSQNVSLKIYNAQGQKVATLLDEMCYGEKVVRWDMGTLPAGVYFYQLRAEVLGQVGTGKIVKY